MAQLIESWRQNPTPTGATIYLQSLSDPHKSYDDKMFILNNLDDWRVITATWFEMARSINIIESLSNDEQFTEIGRSKASLICSKIAYCSEQYNQALDCALASGELFNLTVKDDFNGHDALYVNKIIQQALDTYKQKRNKNMNTGIMLDALVDRIFNQSLEQRDYRSVIGLALDTRRIDMVGKAIEAQESTDTTTFLADTLDKVWHSQLDVQFRGNVLDLILNLFEKQAEAKDLQKIYTKVNAMCQCLIKLDRSQQVAGIIDRLLATNNPLVAYQLAFDLHENAPQQFLGQLKQELAKNNEEDKDKPIAGFKKNLQSILDGEEAIKHHMQFLIKNNHTDMLILNQIKEAARGNCAHNATVIANGLMHTGTTCDDFLRENLEWISKATNWNKFNAVASLGLIHKGHEREAKKILDPYLPKGDQDQFGYKEGGSLYAYGLIHSNHGNQAVIQYLSEQLIKATTSAVRHGACLALGLAALGTRNQNVYEQLREILYQNEAVAGEAAGTAMGLVMAGSMNEEAFQEMRQYILETQHDKIQRGLRTGIAMLAYGALDKAERWIATLEENNSEAIMRQTAVCMMAMAYTGSGKADVILRLLTQVASDPSNDVKRFSTIAIGFVLSGDPSTCLLYVDTLIQHFNGHIRYGAAIALAIASAGTGYKESISKLEPLLQAKENYVRQGALIALSFILIQQTAPTCENVVEFRKNIMKMITEKGEDTITKFGAIIAQGILDAGGRNVTLSLHNRQGQPDMPAVLGTFVFLQNWYWHSMTHFISLAFRPTCLIGLNKELKMPKIEFRCNSKPSLFAYPPPLEEKKKESAGKVETAVLSIANKKKGMPSIAKKKEGSTEVKMEVDDKKEAAAKEEEKPKDVPEPSFHNISNPARVVRLQMRKLSMTDGARYAPIKPISQGGIILFENLKTNEEEEIVELAIAGGVTGEKEAKENKIIEPHSPFEFGIGDY